MNAIPEIRINFSWLLYYDEVQQLKGDGPLETTEQFEKWTDNYQEAWAGKEKIILRAMQEAVGTTFYKPVIDVALSPYFRSKSSPIIINFSNEPDQFVDVLTHELTHVLLTDNAVVQLLSPSCDIDLVKKWTKLFGEHDFNVLVHIPVHAVCKFIWLDVLKEPQRYEREIATLRNLHLTDYLQAWEYVDKHDYKEILVLLKQSYERLKK